MVESRYIDDIEYNGEVHVVWRPILKWGLRQTGSRVTLNCFRKPKLGRPWLSILINIYNFKQLGKFNFEYCYNTGSSSLLLGIPMAPQNVDSN